MKIALIFGGLCLSSSIVMASQTPDEQVIESSSQLNLSTAVNIGSYTYQDTDGLTDEYRAILPKKSGGSSLTASTVANTGGQEYLGRSQVFPTTHDLQQDLSASYAAIPPQISDSDSQAWSTMTNYGYPQHQDKPPIFPLAPNYLSQDSYTLFPPTPLEISPNNSLNDQDHLGQSQAFPTTHGLQDLSISYAAIPPQKPSSTTTGDND